MFALGAGPVLVALVCTLAAQTPARAGDADFLAVGGDALAAASASSASADGPAAAVIDGRVGSPWISAPTDREGAALTLRFTHVRWLAHLDIVVGHGRDNTTYRRSGRAGTLEVRFGDGHSERYPMHDTRRPQRITFVSLAVTDTLTFTMRDVVGPDDAGVAVSEITLYEPRDVSRVDPAFRADVGRALGLLDDPDGAEQAIALLDRFGRHATPFLLQRVMDAASPNRYRALMIVRRNDPASARRAVAHLLQNGTVDDVMLALDVLREAPELEASGVVAELLRRDARTMVRRAAFFALAARPPASGWTELLLATADDPAPGLRREALRMIARSDAPWAVAHLLAKVRAGPIDDARLALELLFGLPRVDRGVVADALRALPPERCAPLLGVVGAHPRPETTALLAELLLAETHHLLYRPVHDALDAHGRAGVAMVLAALEERAEVPPTAGDFLVARADAAADLASQVLERVMASGGHDDLVQTLVEVIAAARASVARDTVIRVFTDPERPTRVRDAALACLGRLEPTPLTLSLVRGQVVAPRSAHRASAYRAAIALRLTDVVPAVRERLDALPPKLWDPAGVEVVAALGAGGDLEFLIDRYLDANRPSQVAILQGAYRAGTTPGVRLLVSAAAGPDGMLRRLAERHLAEARP